MARQTDPLDSRQPESGETCDLRHCLRYELVSGTNEDSR